MTAMYHSGQRALQARFGSTALADRLAEVTHRAAFTDADARLPADLRPWADSLRR